MLRNWKYSPGNGKWKWKVWKNPNPPFRNSQHKKMTRLFSIFCSTACTLQRYCLIRGDTKIQLRKYPCSLHLLSNLHLSELPRMESCFLHIDLLLINSRSILEGRGFRSHLKLLICPCSFFPSRRFSLAKGGYFLMLPIPISFSFSSFWHCVNFLLHAFVLIPQDSTNYTTITPGVNTLLLLLSALTRHITFQRPQPGKCLAAGIHSVSIALSAVVIHCFPMKFCI